MMIQNGRADLLILRSADPTAPLRCLRSHNMAITLPHKVKNKNKCSVTLCRTSIDNVFNLLNIESLYKKIYG